VGMFKELCACVCLALGVSAMPAIASPVGPSGTGPSPMCAHEDGMINGPVVPNQKAAEAVFRAVVGARFARDLVDYPVITVVSEVDHWTVYSTAPPVPAKPDEVVVQFGGGMSMEIDKCTGAVWKFHGNK
jgi:hypothetical protein